MRFVFHISKLCFFLLIFAGAVPCLEAQTTTATAKDPPANLHFRYPNRVSGDKAFDSGEYMVAADFYSKYRAVAMKNKDRSSMRDAFEREIDSWILAGMAEPAEKTLQEFKLEFPDETNYLVVSMWEADILLLKRDAEAAKPILERILPGFHSISPVRMRVLASLAFSLELLKDYKEAAGKYSELYEALGSTVPLGRFAYERMVLNLAASGDYAAAKEKLLSFPPSESERDKEALRLLNMYILVKESGPSAITSLVNTVKIPEDLPQNDTFFYFVMSMIGDEALEKENTDIAVQAYRAAFDAAFLRNDAAGTLQRMIQIFENSGSKAKAAGLTLKQYEIFKDQYADVDTKLRSARILANAGHGGEALEIYESLMDDPDISREQKVDTLKEALSVMVDKDNFDAAFEYARNFFRKYDETEKGEGDLIMAELLLKASHFKEAAAAYLDIAEKYPQFRWTSFYQAALSFLKAKNYDAALKAVDRILDGGAPKNTQNEARYLSGMIHYAKKDYEKAASDYASYAEHADNSEPEKKVTALYEAGRNYFINQNLDAAEQYFSRLLREFPNHKLAPEAYYWMIYTYYRNNKELGAIWETKQLAEKYPTAEASFRAMLDLADFYINSGNMQQANRTLSELTEMEEMAGMQSKAYYQKALLAFDARNYDEAAAFIKTIEERYSNDSILPEAFFLQGMIYKEKKDYENALIFYQKASARRPASLLELKAIAACGDIYFLIAAKNDPAKNYQAALNEYMNLLSKIDEYKSHALKKDASPEQNRAALLYYEAMALYKSARCYQRLNMDQEAVDTYAKLRNLIQPREAAAYPLERIWSVKGIEAMINMAIQRPSRVNIEASLKGLDWLAEAGIQPRDVADQRKLELKKLRYRP